MNICKTASDEIVNVTTVVNKTFLYISFKIVLMFIALSIDVQ